MIDMQSTLSGNADIGISPLQKEGVSAWKGAVRDLDAHSRMVGMNGGGYTHAFTGRLSTALRELLIGNAKVVDQEHLRSVERSVLSMADEIRTGLNGWSQQHGLARDMRMLMLDAWQSAFHRSEQAIVSNWMSTHARIYHREEAGLQPLFQQAKRITHELAESFISALPPVMDWPAHLTASLQLPMFGQRGKTKLLFEVLNANDALSRLSLGLVIEAMIVSAQPMSAGALGLTPEKPGAAAPAEIIEHAGSVIDGQVREMGKKLEFPTMDSFVRYYVAADEDESAAFMRQPASPDVGTPLWVQVTAGSDQASLAEAIAGQLDGLGIDSIAARRGASTPEPGCIEFLVNMEAGGFGRESVVLPG